MTSTAIRKGIKAAAGTDRPVIAMADTVEAILTAMALMGITLLTAAVMEKLLIKATVTTTKGAPLSAAGGGNAAFPTAACPRLSANGLKKKAKRPAVCSARSIQTLYRKNRQAQTRILPLATGSAIKSSAKAPWSA